MRKIREPGIVILQRLRILTVLSFHRTYIIIYAATSCTTFSFVYLKSIKDLSSFLASVLSESGCKGKCFFSFCQTFWKFFSKKFFSGRPEG